MSVPPAVPGPATRLTILIAGPTGGGKSSLALALAERLGGRIINADSAQVYEQLAILTARPSAADLARADHRLYGYLPVGEPGSAARWAVLARREIDAAHRAGMVAMVVGGTGLYFQALVQGLAEIPDVPAGLRSALAARLAAEGAPALHAELARRDPLLAARLKPGDSQRILRGLEVAEATARPLSAWQADPLPPPPDLGRLVRLVVAPDRECLLRRQRLRLEAMIAGGVLDEVRAVLRLDLDPRLPAMKAIGLRPLAAHLGGAVTLAEALDLAEIETRQYAKRQMTWARQRMADWEWMSAQQMERCRCEIENLIQKSGLTTQE